MRITHVNFARGFRGGERQTLNLMTGLAELGVQQTLVCRNDSVLSRRVAALGIPSVALAHPLLGHFSSPQADLIHVHEARGAYWAGIEHALRGTRYVITRRIPNPISNSVVTSNVYRHASRLLGVSQDVSWRLAKQTGLPVQTILSSTTVHAVNPERVAEIRKMLGGGPVIGHVGALHDHHKGQSVLIRAFHQLLARDYPQARLLLVGEGPDREQFEKLAKGDPRIHFAGLQQDVGSWIAAMDVFAFPSREEGLGSSVLDAMALGVPVVASAVGGLPELTGGGQRGLLVQGHDPASWSRSIRYLLSDQAMRTRQIGAARQFADANGVGAMTKAYFSLYNNILSSMPVVAESTPYAAGIRH